MLNAGIAKKLMTVIFLGVTLLAVGCAGQSTTTSTQPPTTTVSPAVSTTSPKPASTTVAPTTTTTTTTTTTKTTAAASRVTSWSSPPAMQIDKSKKYFATVETSLGTFKIELYASETPVTVNNFVFLSQQGFYNGVIFHRIIKAFMIQTGDPLGTGMGGPGYKFNDELPVKHQYAPGLVAMANSGANTNGSQFFICTGANSSGLNSQPNYTQFGNVVEGMDIVQKIASVAVVSNGREVSQPVTPPVIKSITISNQ